MSEWISVKDKLPDLDQVVMVCWPSGYDGKPLYAWGARLDDAEGWLWGVAPGGCAWISPGEDAAESGIEADDDYPVQFWKPLEAPPQLSNGER